MIKREIITINDTQFQKTWVSDIDNNVLEPGLHGWTELDTTK